MFGRPATLRAALLAGLMLGAASGTAEGQGQIVEYYGMCEASAAVAVGPDRFLVAQDQDSTLRLYARSDSRPLPLAGADVSAALGVEPRTKTDIEAAAAVGNRAYWLTSHGGNRPEQRRFFATEIVGEGPQATLKLVGTPYLKLRDDMLQDSALAPYGLAAAAPLPPQDPGGFNIEGLAAMPDGKLLIGFRNPIPKGRALVIQFDNPDEVLTQPNARARFGRAFTLDLDGLGIRSMDRVGNAYMIIAGSYDDLPGHSLRLWSGVEGEKPRVLPQPILADADIDLRPEALFAIPGTDAVQMLSDEGDVPVLTAKCKDKSLPTAKKMFRSLIVTP